MLQNDPAITGGPLYEPSPLARLIGGSRLILQVRNQIQRIARSPVPVLILGETGTGKEICAEAIAALSGRSPFVPVNIAALPQGLVESELFGHERGAFTGAVKARVGMIAVAHHGTLFLDELAEIPSSVQAKLLGTLESGEYRVLGASRPQHSEFRILAATSEDVDQGVATRQLRSDLLHRLGAVRVHLPPLRERVEDIPVLVSDILRRYQQRTRAASALRLSGEACTVLIQQSWPGNVRQLRNVVEAAAALAGHCDTVAVEHVTEVLGWSVPPEPDRDHPATLASVRQRAEREAIRGALQRAGGNRGRAARLLGISEATLYRKLGDGVEDGSVAGEVGARSATARTDASRIHRRTRRSESR